MRKTPLIAIIVSVILLLGLLARASLNNRELDARFRTEMAQRFDLEKKLLSLEKERAGLYTRIKSLTGQLEESRSSYDLLRASLDLAAEENKGLKDALSQLRNNIDTQPAGAASDAM